jgi:tetratricopeptide (TPR) repeat protein
MARKISPPAGRPAAPRPAPAEPLRRETEVVENFFLGVLLFFLAILVFYPAFQAGFIWDDDQLLTSNTQVHDPHGWWTLWISPQTADYFPLNSTTLWIQYHLGLYFRLWNVDFLQYYANQGFWNGYHIMNVLFHATAVILTWQMLKRLRIPGAWVAAALFAVHPVCVESVAWISEGKNTTSQIFLLLAIIHYVRFEEKGRVWRYVAAVLCFLLSLLAKTSVVMLPFILLILAWWRHKELEPLRPNYELEKNPVERGILLGTFVLAGLIAGAAAMLLRPPWGFGLGEGLAAGFGAGSKFYLSFALLLVGLAAGVGVGAAAGLFLRKLKHWDSFAGFEVIRSLPFFLAAFLLGAVTVYFQYGFAIGQEQIPIGNWWQRIASACFAAGFYLYSALWPFNLIEIYPQWHRAFSLVVTEPRPHMEQPAPESISYWYQVIPGLVIGGLLIFCWVRRKESWARALLAGLGCYFVAMLPALGLLKMSYMRLTLVADHFQYISIVAVIALVVAAGWTRPLKAVWLCLAAAFFSVASYLNWAQSDDNHAAQLVWIGGALALAVFSQREDIWKWVWGGFLGIVLLCSSVISRAQTGIYYGEESLWSATLAKNPYTWQGHNHLGAALYMRKDIKDAFPHFLKATQLKPENPESHNNLGLAYSYFGMKDQAIEQYQIATGIKDDSSMDTNLANAYEEEKRFPEAIETYHHALKLSPDNASALCNLGYALMREGNVPEAIGCFIHTVKVAPEMPQGRADLADALHLEGIDYTAPVLSGTYPFDAQTAVNLLRRFPPDPPQQQPAQQ